MEPTTPGVDISIVIPVYYNEGSLLPLMRTLHAEVIDRYPDRTIEVVFVDDGSGDGSFAELAHIREQNPDRVTVVKLTRNFGQASALLAGFRLARGACVIAMSADGQDPASLINDMLDAWFDEHYEVVICTRNERDESRFRIVTSRLFYMLMQRLSFPDMPLGGFDFFLLGRRALNTFLRNQETHPFFQGQILWMGYDAKLIEYQRQRRQVGRSRWTLSKRLTYVFDAVFSYSFLPIRLASGLGALIALLGFLYALVIFVGRLVWAHPVEGWAPLMIVVLVLGGSQMLMLGIMGEYVWRTLAQTRNRESYIVERVLGPQPDDTAPTG